MPGKPLKSPSENPSSLWIPARIRSWGWASCGPAAFPGPGGAGGGAFPSLLRLKEDVESKHGHAPGYLPAPVVPGNFPLFPFSSFSLSLTPLFPWKDAPRLLLTLFFPWNMDGITSGVAGTQLFLSCHLMLLISYYKLTMRLFQLYLPFPVWTL